MKIFGIQKVRLWKGASINIVEDLSNINVNTTPNTQSIGWTKTILKAFKGLLWTFTTSIIAGLFYLFITKVGEFYKHDYSTAGIVVASFLIVSSVWTFQIFPFIEEFLNRKNK